MGIKTAKRAPKVGHRRRVRWLRRLLPKGVQAFAVARNRVVLEIPPHHLLQPQDCSRNPRVHPPLQLRFDDLQLRVLIPMKVDSDSDLIPVTRSDGMPVTFGA